MALCAAYLKFMRNISQLKPISARPFNNVQPRMNVGTFQKPLENAEKPKVSNFKKYYELIPLFVIVGGGITGLLGYVARIALTRDDVRYNPNSKMPYEIFDMEKDKQPKARKFLVFNQKYETPEGLVDAMEAITEGEDKTQAAKKSK